MFTYAIFDQSQTSRELVGVTKANNLRELEPNLTENQIAVVYEELKTADRRAVERWLYDEREREIDKIYRSLFDKERRKTTPVFMEFKPETEIDRIYKALFEKRKPS